MKKTLLALAFLSCFSTTAKTAEEGPWVDPKRFTVQNDGGGSVSDFKVALTYFKKNSSAFSISGYCASACTLLLSREYSLDVCVQKDVRFGFHKPFAMDVMGVVANQIPYIYRSEQMWTEEFLKKYPEWLQSAIKARGDVPAAIQGDKPNDLMWFSYEDVRRFIKTCIPKAS